MPYELVTLHDRQFLRSRDRGWGVQCTANKRAGGRCGNWAITGAYVCRKHGGCLPVVKASANARFRALLESAIQVVAEGLESPKEAHRLRTAKYIMRVNGITPATIRRIESRGERAALPAGKGAPASLDDEIEGLVAALAEVEDEAA